MKYGKTDSEAKYEQVLPGCVGLGGKAHSLRKLESLGINKNREPFYDDPLYMTSRNKTNMYKVKQPFKQNRPFVNGPKKTFGNRFVKSKIKIRRQSRPNEILYQDIFIEQRKAKTGSKYPRQTLRIPLLHISHCI